MTTSLLATPATAPTSGSSGLTPSIKDSQFLVTLLKETRLWPGLDKVHLEVLASHMEYVVLQKGDIICKEGENSGQFYIIVDGSAESFKRVKPEDPESESVKLLSLKAGEYIGETPLLEGKPSTATLIAGETPTRMFRLSNATFKTFLESQPAIANSLLRGLSAELRSFRSVLARTISNQSIPTTDSLTKKLLPRHVVRMAVFDFMKHEKTSFQNVLDNFIKTTDGFKTGDVSLDIKYYEAKLDTSTVSLAAGCQVVAIFVNDTATAEVLTLLQSQGVKLLTLRCAGFDNVDLKAATALGLTVTRVPAYSPYAVAEFAVTLAMALNRKIVHASGRVRQGNFALHGLVGFDFHGKTVGVIGTGKIGQCFVKIMLGFGCKVLCYDAYPSAEVAGWEGSKYVTLDELYAQSKVISLHAPLLPTTKHMINSESLAKMQKGVMIINTSRGGLIDTQALIQALKSGQVYGAGLDVYENEKSMFFEDHSGSVMEDDAFVRLLSFPNVIVTGHQAFLTEEALERIASVTLENVKQVIVEGKKGKDVENRV